ncbi:protein P54-like [Scomber scombrus]|uniref:Protein P54-like n=1 Tax=Scomber scombrus TaxID=13677 RepID=A0AAV1P2D7_SCOSC
MKHLFLGLFSLALLRFICAQTQPSAVTTAMNITTNTTAPSNTTSSNTTGTSPNMVTVTTPSTVTTKNGKSHLFTSVSLLFGSFALHALWQ